MVDTEKKKIAQKKYRQSHSELLKEKSKLYRLSHPEICKNARENWRENNDIYIKDYRVKRREVVSIYNSEYAKKYPERITANELAKRKVKLNEFCEFCGNIARDRHHPDYSKPLEVLHLCKSCHQQIHSELRRENDCKNKMHQLYG